MAIEAITQSILGMGLNCGEQLRRRYIEGETIPPGIAALRGTGAHEAARVNNAQKLRTGVDLSGADMKDAANEKFKAKAADEGIYMTKEDVSSKTRIINDGLNDCLRCVEVYHDEVAPLVQPIGVEERFIIEAGFALPLSFQIDWWTEDHVIGDLKTTTQKWPKDRIKTEIQPIFYSYGYWKFFEKPPKSFDYHIAIARRGKTGDPTSAGADLQQWTPERKNYYGMFHKIDALIKALKHGILSPTKEVNWWCDPKWCGYYYTCKYVGNEPAGTWR